MFCAVLVIEDRSISKGCGISKSKAKSNAASKGLSILLENGQSVDYDSDLISSLNLDGLDAKAMIEKTIEEQKIIETVRNSVEKENDPDINRLEEIYEEAFSTFALKDKPSSLEIVPGLTMILPHHGELYYPVEESNHGKILYHTCEKIIAESCQRSKYTSKVVITKNPPENLHTCKLFVANKLITSANHSNIEKCRDMVFQEGVTLLQQSQICRYKSDEGYFPLQKGETIEGLTLQFKAESDYDYHRVLKDSCKECSVELCMIMHGKVEFKWIPIWCVILVIKDRQISKGFGEDVKKASFDAARKAVPILIENGQKTSYKSSF